MQQQLQMDRRGESAWLPRTAAIILLLSAASGPARAAEDATPAWQAQVLQQIAESEYHVTRQETTTRGSENPWQAPNRAHGFRTYFFGEGVRLEPRTEEGSSWRLGLSPSRIGREGALLEIGPAESIDVVETRVELPRDGFVEWYVNGPGGLEQGFDVAGPPPGPSSRGPLLIEIAVTGSLLPRFSADGQAVDLFSARDGMVLRYAKLVVIDAAGSRLGARMESFARPGTGGIRLVIDDGTAVYPIVVDPLTTGAAWSDEGNQIDAEFGFSVATAGDVNGDGYSDAIVGARMYDNGQSNEGRAFVYHGSSSGLSLTADWDFDSDDADAELGFSVQTAGDVNGDGYSDIIVGCPKCDVGGLLEGRAYVFHGSGSGLSATPAWFGDGDQGGMEYGASVAAAGDVNGDGYGDALVGAPLRDVGGTDDGRAYLYYGSPSGLGAANAEIFDGGFSGFRFGASVSGVGDLNADGFADLAIGAPGADGTFIDEGEVSVYLGASTGPVQFSVPGPTDKTDARFGTSVAAAGDVNGDGYADMIVGAPGFGAANEGRAYVFFGEAGGVDLFTPWFRDGGTATMLFGHAVGTAGDINGDGYADIIVGAPDFTTDLIGPKGGAFVFLGSSAGIDSAPAWEVESDDYFGRYGESVGTAGDINGDGFSDIIVGASQYDNPQAKEGRAYVYLGSAAGLSESSSWSVSGDAQLDQLGFTVAAAGDVNGDGYGDVIVGAPNHDAMFADSGHARVYHGSANGLGLLPAWDTNGDSQGDRLGYTVGGAGDVNGDGFSDVIVGVPNLNFGGTTDVGQARVYHGSPLGLTSSIADWTETGTQQFAQFGIAVAAAGDVNGDGVGDVIIGEPFHDGTAMESGRAFVYHGSQAGGLASSASWTGAGSVDDGRYGWSVASAGDVNSDGYSDIIVGEPTGCSTCGPSGAYLYLGTAAGVAGTPAWSDHRGSSTINTRFGWSVASAGDLNGDGFADVVIGNPLDASLGHINVYYGSQSGLHVPADWQASGQSVSSDMGWSVGTAGDVNGDGFADLVAGEPRYLGTQFDEGRLHIWLGSASGPAMGQATMITGNELDARLGYSVASAGDIDGDGYADLIAGAPGAKTLGIEKGKALIYLGNGAEGNGVDLLPRQLRADGSGPVHSLGESDDAGSFLLQLFARTPFGRGRVRMQSEVKPLGTLLDGSGVQAPAGFTDSGGPAFATLIESASGLTPGAIYHWRVRLEYDSVTQLFAPASRWLTIPLNGWQEADLRMNDGAVAGAGAGIVPDDAANQLVLSKDAAGDLALQWGDSCNTDDDDFAIYTGTIGCFASHVVETCSTGGVNSFSVSMGTCDAGVPPDPCQPPEPVQPPDPCRQYFLVAPINTAEGREGSVGFDSRGLPRSPGRQMCLRQGLAECAGAIP